MQNQRSRSEKVPTNRSTKSASAANAGSKPTPATAAETTAHDATAATASSVFASSTARRWTATANETAATTARSQNFWRLVSVTKAATTDAVEVINKKAMITLQEMAVSNSLYGS